MVTSLPASAGDIRDMGLIPGLGRSPGGGHGSPLQYSCLENPMDRGAWWATGHGVAKSQTQLKPLSTAQQPCRGRRVLFLQPSNVTQLLGALFHSSWEPSFPGGQIPSRLLEEL